jgi:hypothetical protein
MTNPNVRKRLAKLRDELQYLSAHVAHYEDIDEEHAREIDNTTTDIVEIGARIAARAREREGLPARSARSLVNQVRKALGFTNWRR